MAALVVPQVEQEPCSTLRDLLLYAISRNLRMLDGFLDPEHDRELDEMIAAGWGSTPQANIPSDWRQRRGPERVTTFGPGVRSEQTKEAIRQGMKRRRAQATEPEFKVTTSSR